MSYSKKLCGADNFSHKDEKGFSYFNYLEFNGKTFLFSGDFLGKENRNKIYSEKIEERGGKFKDNNFSRSVDIFICGEKPGERKKTNVEKYNEQNPDNFIHTITQKHLDELIEKCKPNPPPPFSPL